MFDFEIVRSVYAEEAAIDMKEALGKLYELEAFLLGKAVSLAWTFPDGRRIAKQIGEYNGVEVPGSGIGTDEFEWRWVEGWGFHDRPNLTIPFDSTFRLRGDEEGVQEMAEALKLRGFSVAPFGRSSFAARNYIEVSGFPIAEYEVFEVEVAQRVLELDDGLEVPAYRITCKPGETREFPDASGAMEVIEEIRDEKRRMRHKRFMERFKFSSTDGGLTGAVEVGGVTGLSHLDRPDNLALLYEYMTLATKDHRQRRSHTYRLILVDLGRLSGKRALEVKIPDSQKGRFIGKGGESIRRLQKELEVRITVR